MIVLGINALNHDASVCVFDNEIIFHRKSPDNFFLNENLVEEALSYGTPQYIAWYENPWLKKSRQLFAGQFKEAFSLKNLPKNYLQKFYIDLSNIKYISHHQSHASYGIFYSKEEDTCVLVADAIGEWNTVTLWHYKNNKYNLLLKKNYPYSLGLYYSAFTELVGLKPVKDESKFTELSRQGDSDKYIDKAKSYLNKNLHKGIWNWHIDFNDDRTKFNIAAAVQKVFETEIIKFAKEAQQYSSNLVFTGGCAYNQLVREKLKPMFNNFYVPDYPGDSGSSIGAAYFLHTKFSNK